MGNIPPLGLPGTNFAAPQPAGVAPVQAPQPQLAAPGTTMAPDTAAPGLQGAVNPQLQQAVSVLSYQLYSANPIDVSLALAQLEALGPAARDLAGQAVVAQLTPGMTPVKAQVMMDALVRWNDKAAVAKLQQMTQDPDPETRKTASQGYARLAGVTAAGFAAPALPGAAANGPLPANQPLAGAAPTAAPGAGPTPAAASAGLAMSGPLPPELVSIVERLRDPKTLPQAAVELAQMPVASVVQVGNALMSDNSLLQLPDVLGLMASVLSKRPNPQDPAVRGLLGKIAAYENGPIPISDHANVGRGKAATALAMYGDAQDVKNILKYLADPQADMNMLHFPIEQLCLRPQLLKQDPAVAVVLDGLQGSRVPSAGVAAARGLAAIATPQAWAMLGASPLLRNPYGSIDQKNWVLDWLANAPQPMPQGTIAVLQKTLGDLIGAGSARMTQQEIDKLPKPNQMAADKVKALLKKSGVSA